MKNTVKALMLICLLWLSPAQAQNTELHQAAMESYTTALHLAICKRKPYSNQDKIGRIPPYKDKSGRAGGIMAQQKPAKSARMDVISWGLPYMAR